MKEKKIKTKQPPREKEEKEEDKCIAIIMKFVVFSMVADLCPCTDDASI